MALPHPQSRKDHYRKEDKPGRESIVRKFFKRTVDIAEYRNTEDNVNPAKNQTLGALVHEDILLLVNAAGCVAGCFEFTKIVSPGANAGENPAASLNDLVESSSNS